MSVLPPTTTTLPLLGVAENRVPMLAVMFAAVAAVTASTVSVTASFTSSPAVGVALSEADTDSELGLSSLTELTARTLNV